MGKGVECNFGRTSAISCCPIEGSISFNRVTPPSISFQIPSASHTSPPCPPPTAFQIADAQSETLLAGVELARVLADAEAFDESGEVDEEPTLERTSLLRSSENVRERRERDALVSNSLEDPWSGSDGVMLRVQATVRHVRDRGTFVNVDI